MEFVDICWRTRCCVA